MSFWTDEQARSARRVAYAMAALCGVMIGIVAFVALAGIDALVAWVMR